MSAPIVVATSIPPRLARQNAGRAIHQEYQALCIRSWIECGFRVLSVNDRSEIGELSARYPGVTFVPVDRNASALCGRNTPYIADLLSSLSTAPEPIVGIVNSDIIFDPRGRWSERLPKLAKGGVVTGQRYDTKSLLYGILNPYRAGFDYFFFERSDAAELAEDALPFAMGVAWWDYWLPITLALKGRSIVHIDAPATIHLFHADMQSDEAWRPAWRRLAVRFTESVAKESDNFRKACPPSLSPLLPHIRNLLGSSVSASLDAEITDLAGQCSGAIRANATRFERDYSEARSEPGDRLTPEASFRNFENRCAAVEILGKAVELEGQGTNPERMYRMALEKAPDDGDVLFCCGNYFLSQGQAPYAAMLLQKAAERAPQSRAVMHTLGCALAAMRRGNEAIACFDKALAIDPQYGPAYYSLAVALHSLSRHQEALTRLEKILGERPDFPEGPEWRRRIREKLSSLDEASS